MLLTIFGNRDFVQFKKRREINEKSSRIESVVLKVLGRNTAFLNILHAMSKI